MTDKASETGLLERIRAGEKKACVECVEIHSPGIYRLALRLMRQEADAEEVVQETFLSAFKGIDRFDGRSDLRTWLYRIAYNAAMMRLRRAGPEEVSVEEAAEPEEGALIPRALMAWKDLPEEELEKAEVREELERAIRDLPEKLRAVFVMRELEHIPTDGTASALGISEDVVKTRLHRARLRLRERLAPYFALPAEEAGGNHGS
ncbi:MAG: sigma-70 family RNA polymerase sigma factor [Anaerolineales bacterium]|nr:sigma-70 family RNA polymerase sigma factor [Anaerolineales bacterium]